MRTPDVSPPLSHVTYHDRNQSTTTIRPPFEPVHTNHSIVSDSALHFILNMSRSSTRENHQLYVRQRSISDGVPLFPDAQSPWYTNQL